MPKPSAHPLDHRPARLIYETLGRYPYLTREQLARLYYQGPSGPKYTSRWLSELRKHRLVNDLNFLPKLTAGPGSSKILWSRQPGKKEPTYSWNHPMLVADCLIACERFARDTEGIELLDVWHDQELRKNPVRFSGGTVIPDGFVALGLKGHKIGLWLEADCGSESKDDPYQSVNWTKKLERLVPLAKDGAYRERFGVENIRVAVVTRTRRSEERQKQLIHWTEEILASDPAWAQLFLFTTADPDALSPREFVSGTHWVSPFTYQTLPLIAS